MKNCQLFHNFFDKYNAVLHLQNLINLSFIALTTLFFVGCKSKEFSTLKATNNKSVEELNTTLSIRYCPATSSQTISENLFLVAVDFSGSNTSRDGDCFIGTDETQKRLYELIDFIQQQTVNPGKSNLHIAIVPFGTKASFECYRIFNNKSSSFIEYALTSPDDIKDKKHQVYDIIQRLIDDEAKPPGYEQFIPESCKGWTNYLEALQAMSAIKKEFMMYMKAKYPASGQAQSMVFINGFFLSDGEPIVQGQSQDDIKIFSNVYDFIYLDNDKSNSNIKNVFTFLNTGYYTAPYTLQPGRSAAECPVPVSAKRTAIRVRCQKAKCKLSSGLSYTCGSTKPSVSCSGEKEGDSCKVGTQAGSVIKDENIGSRLCDMSDIGGGSFFDLQNNPDYTDFKMTTFFNPYKSEKITFSNINGRWDYVNQKATYNEDSDGDGLSNTFETEKSSAQLLLDPYKFDSNNNSIRDSVEFYLNALSGIDATTCVQSLGIKDTDLDGLSDCEEQLLGFNPKISDENLNQMPDGLDWINKIQVTTQNSSQDIDGDLLTNQQEVYSNLPVNIHNKYLPDNIKLQTEKTIEDPNNKSCKITTISNFRYAKETQSFTTQFWFYSKQMQGELKHLTHGEFTLKPGEQKTINAADYTKGISYEGN